MAVVAGFVLDSDGPIYGNAVYVKGLALRFQADEGRGAAQR